MLRHGTTNQIINKSIIKPIPKNKQKSLSDSNNYRAISKNSIISKIIDYVIIQLINDKMSTSAYQFGYKEKFSTSLCSFLDLKLFNIISQMGQMFIWCYWIAQKPLTRYNIQNYLKP